MEDYAMAKGDTLSKPCAKEGRMGENRLTLKWGTVKGWHAESEEAKAALQKWADFGVSISAITQHDTPEQQQALLDAIDHFDEIWLDWEGIQVTQEQAKEYVRNYGKPEPQGADHA